MKKLLAGALLLLLTGCTTTTTADDTVLRINDFIHFTQDEVRYFESEQPGGDHTITTEVVTGTRALQRTVAEHIEQISGLRIEDGVLELFFIPEAPDQDFDITTVDPNVSMIILAEPLEVGNTWATDFSEVEITDFLESFQLGDDVFYDVLQVTQHLIDGSYVVTYYARDYGLIKERFSSLFTRMVDGVVTETILSEYSFRRVDIR